MSIAHLLSGYVAMALGALCVVLWETWLRRAALAQTGGGRGRMTVM